MGPTLMNCCKLEQLGTKEYGKMLKRIQILEDGRVPAKEARHWKIEGLTRRITRKEYQRLLYKFVMVVKRKCVNPVEAFDIFSHGEISECDSCGVKSDCGSVKWSGVLATNDVHVLPFFRGGGGG